jgi:hypothetical protein
MPSRSLADLHKLIPGFFGYSLFLMEISRLGMLLSGEKMCLRARVV